MKAGVIDRVCKILHCNSATVRELHDRMGGSDTCIRRHVRTLHGVGMLHISHYQTGSNNQQEAVFAWGEGEDAPMPAGVAKRQKFQDEIIPIPMPRLDLWHDRVFAP